MLTTDLQENVILPGERLPDCQPNRKPLICQAAPVDANSMKRQRHSIVFAKLDNNTFGGVVGTDFVLRITCVMQIC
jgi:hypothetical protein